MTKFEGCYLTNNGLELCMQEGLKKIHFTKAAAGSGKYLSKNEVKELSELKEQKQEFNISSYSITGGSTVSLVFYLKNDGLTEGYNLSELGVFAEDESGNEVLYCVAFAYEGNEEFIPDEGDSFNYYSKITLDTAISSEAEVIINTGVYRIDSDFSSTSENALENRKITGMFLKFLDLSLVDAAFLSTFPGLRDDAGPENAMTKEQVDEALHTEWAGESSTDPYAMTREEIYLAIETEWDGRTSADKDALSADEVRQAVKNTDI